MPNRSTANYSLAPPGSPQSSLTTTLPSNDVPPAYELNSPSKTDSLLPKSNQNDNTSNNLPYPINNASSHPLPYPSNPENTSQPLPYSVNSSTGPDPYSETLPYYIRPNDPPVADSNNQQTDIGSPNKSIKEQDISSAPGSQVTGPDPYSDTLPYYLGPSDSTPKKTTNVPEPASAPPAYDINNPVPIAAYEPVPYNQISSPSYGLNVENTSNSSPSAPVLDTEGNCIYNF